jgi:glycosyltransferase involved in cell wall biosynthesis
MLAAGATVAVATGILGKATETGVRRHVAELFGGRTVVLCERREPGHVDTRPTFVQNPEGVDPEFLLGKPVGSLRYRAPNVPFGRRRRALEAFLKAHRVAAILGEFGHIGCNLAPVGQALGIPVITYFRGFDASKRLREPRIVRRYRAAMPRLAGVVAVSRFLLDNLAAHEVTHANSAVIPTGVDTRVFVPGPKDQHLVLAVGRIVAKKAPLITIDAFAAAARNLPHRLEIIGDGEMRGACEERARSLGLGDRIVFHGARDHAFVRERLARAAVFLQHSVTDAEGNAEGLPTAIQEAMASGAAVVATRHAGIPEAIEPGATGLLVEEHDVAGFAEAIGTVLADPELAARFGAQARVVAEERFEYRRLHARLEAMIGAACQADQRPTPAV